jgi:hypothetical protein
MDILSIRAPSSFLAQLGAFLQNPNVTATEFQAIIGSAPITTLGALAQMPLPAPEIQAIKQQILLDDRAIWLAYQTGIGGRLI